MAKPFYAYMLSCSDDSYYVGCTDNLEKRISEHNEGEKRGYTSKRRPVRLVWSQEFQTRGEAKEAEKQLKGWTRAKKEALARGDLDLLVILSRKRDWDGYRQRRKQENTPAS